MAANFVLNPYLGDVNPGTADGLKLYNKATEAPDTKIDVDQHKARDIQSLFAKDASDFGWGPGVGLVQVDNATPPTLHSILSNARDISLKPSKSMLDALGVLWRVSIGLTLFQQS